MAVAQRAERVPSGPQQTVKRGSARTARRTADVFYTGTKWFKSKQQLPKGPFVTSLGHLNAKISYLLINMPLLVIISEFNMLKFSIKESKQKLDVYVVWCCELMY